MGGNSRLEEAYKILVNIAKECKESRQKDPAFAHVLLPFADIAGQLLNDHCLRLECIVAVLRYTTARQCFSVVTCYLAADLLGAALDLMNAGQENVLESR